MNVPTGSRLGPYEITNFDVSPDGEQIIFDRVRDNADFVVMDLLR